MRGIRLDADARDLFLGDARLGTLSLIRPDGTPAGVPLWYTWDGRRVAMFSERRSAKVRWLARDPRVAVLVTNIPPEPPRWVSLEGRAELRAEGGHAVAECLVRRYLGAGSAADVRAALQRLERLELVEICFEPERIRSHAEIG